MTPEEFNKKVNESKHEKWCQEISYRFYNEVLNYDYHLQGLTAIHTFLLQQIEAWEKATGELPKAFENSKSFFIKFRERLENFVDRQLNHYHYSNSEISLHDAWEHSILSSLTHSKNLFFYDLPETLFLLQLDSEFPESFDGACDYILQRTKLEDETDQSTYLTGLLMAYEFNRKDRLPLPDRNAAEENSLASIRGKFQLLLTESIEHYTLFQNNIRQQYDESVDKIEKLKNEKATDYNNWFGSTKQTFETFSNETNQRVKDLEKSYAEVLRLKKPAEYWNQRATILKKEGWRAVYWLIGLVAVACATLYFLLWMTPEGMLRSFFNGEASAIKWSIIYITFISFLAYVIRAIHKVAFSSFHLARDAEEREQLTYVYLALIKDSSVNDSDKHLILNSLFSRADTGLLKDDSGPTMPGTLVEKIGK